MYYGTLTNSSVAANAQFPFVAKYLTNTNITSDNGTLTIVTPGFYRIHFDATFTAAGDVVPTLVVNGTASTTAFTMVTSDGTSSAADYVQASFDTVIYVRQALSDYVTVAVTNAGVAASSVNANLIVDRLQ